MFCHLHLHLQTLGFIVQSCYISRLVASTYDNKFEERVALKFSCKDVSKHALISFGRDFLNKKKEKTLRSQNTKFSSSCFCSKSVFARSTALWDFSCFLSNKAIHD